MQINKYHGSYNISYKNQNYKYIVCHYVGAGDSSAGSALANCKYFASGNRNSSANYFIDDSGIWEYADPDKYYSWHCGDGSGKYGITNSNSIGIEVCINGDVPYTKAEQGYLRELVLHLMNKYNIPAINVVRHYDASRKLCPYYYAKRGDEWEKLRTQITTKEKPVATKNIRGIELQDFIGNATQRFWAKQDSWGNIIGLRNAATYCYISDPHSSTKAIDALLYEDDGNTYPREPQELTIIKNDNGTISIAPKVAPDLRLDVKDASTKNGATIQWYPKNLSRAQEWLLVGDATSGYNLISALNYKAATSVSDKRL